MIVLAPWLAWLAPVTSLVLLIVRTTDDRPSRILLAVLWCGFAAAVYFQFFGRTELVSAGALGAQTLLAAGLLIWRKVEP